MPARMVSRVRRLRRHAHIRRHMAGTTEVPRLNVFRSSAHIYVQLIDDANGHTLAAASTLDESLRGQRKGETKTKQAADVGHLIAERAKAAGVDRVVFDRGGNLYHGRVKALAEAARAGGLQF